jgi:branched-chain amino acid transport system permease protein
MDIIIQSIGDGLVLGAFYSLIALGYTMVYGIIRLLNFAHGDFYMFGAFLGYTGLSFLMGGSIGSSLLGIGVVLFITIVVVGLVGMGVERVAYRPLLNAPRLSLLITALGVGLALEYGSMVAWGPNYVSFPVKLPTTGFTLLGANLTYSQIILVLVAAALMFALQKFIHGTAIGKAMRAIAMDQTATSLMGVNIYRVIAITFFIGTALAASAGIMSAVYYGTINFMMGFIMGLKAFTAAVLGGIGNIKGAMLGGFLLGILETFGTMFMGGAWKDVLAFSILILFLIFKPTGILGKQVTERM